MLRVGDLDRSTAFYTEILGMKLMRKDDYPEGKFTNVFIGYGDETTDAVLELTHNWETSEYDIGSAYGHIAIEVDDVYRAVEDIRKRGGEISREAGPMKGGSRVLAFVRDPDGYAIELLGVE
jgi:lactoylglutathione lyase